MKKTILFGLFVLWILVTTNSFLNVSAEINWTKTKAMVREERKQRRQEVKEERKAMRVDQKSLVLAFRDEVKLAFESLPQETNDALNTLREEYLWVKKELRNSYDNHYSEDFITAMHELVTEQQTAFLELIPEDQKSVWEELFSKQSILRENYQQERTDFLYENYSETTQMLLDRVNEVLLKIEWKVTDPAKLTLVYQKLITKFESVIEKLENNNRLPQELVSTRVEVYEALIVTIQEKIDGIDVESIEDEFVDLVEDLGMGVESIEY